MVRILNVLTTLLIIGGVAQHVSAQTPLDYHQSCAAAGCHAEYGQRAVVHEPVKQDSCDACHEAVEGMAHKFEFVEEGGDLCLECHEFDDVKVPHQPFAEGTCLACHDPHGSPTRKLLLAKSELELCTECHDDPSEDLDFLHGPVAAGTCTSCHSPHGSDHGKLLSAEGAAVCTKCHQDLGTKLAGKGTVHEPVKGGCLDCHNPHGGSHKMFLGSAPPELCLDCHDDIGELMEDAEVQHDALTEGRSCVACHNPHVSTYDSLLIGETMPLCLSCHDKELKSGEDTLRNMAEHLDKHKLHHGPVQDEDCTACHTPHGGDSHRLLTDAFPTTFYASYEEDQYALCFGCHDVELVEEEETDEATGFRNGERNLHFVHVNKAVKGRTCRACHDPHASSKPKHIADSVPFGAWSIPTNYEPTPSGGSCQPGCHKLYRYDRESPAVNFPELTPSDSPQLPGAAPGTEPVSAPTAVEGR